MIPRAPRRRPQEPLFKHVGRWIADPRIDVAEFLESEHVRRVLALAELIRRRLIDRHSNGSGRWVGPPTGVQRECFGMECLTGHGLGSFNDGDCDIPAKPDAHLSGAMRSLEIAAGRFVVVRAAITTVPER